MKRLKCVLLTAVIIALCMSSVVFAKDEKLAKKYGVNSYSIAYFDNGECSFDNYGKGIDEQSVFELASNGKVVAAYTALKLVEDGKLNLDDKIMPYLDEKLITSDPRMKDITVRQLLSHTAGFSPSFELGVDKKLYSDPGEKFRYSGVGYIFLQSVIEHASGMSMDEAALHYVFEPLHMEHTTFENMKTVTPMMHSSTAVLYAFAIYIASFLILLLLTSLLGKLMKFKLYSFKSGMITSIVIAGILNTLFLLFIFGSKVLFLFLLYAAVLAVLLFVTRKKKVFYAVMPVWTLLVLLACFALITDIPVTNDLIAKKANCAYTLKSTSEDMMLFCQELMKDAGGNDETVKEMFSEAVKIDDENAWGLGIAIESKEKETTYWHSGINPGFRSLLVLCPNKNKCIIVLTNSDNGLDFAKEKANDFLETNENWNIKR